MDHGNGALVALLLKVRVKFPQLMDQKHSLVNNGPGGEGADIGGVAALLKNPPDDIELPIKVQPPGNLRRALHEALENGRHGFPGFCAQHLCINGDLPPSYEGDALLAADHLQQLLSFPPL